MIRSPKVLLPLLLCLFGVLLWLHFKNKADPATAGLRESTTQQVSTLIPDTSASTPKTESHWLVDEIGKDIAEMLSFAKGNSEVNFTCFITAEPNVFRLAAAGSSKLEKDITLKHYLWSPEHFSLWAEACMASLSLTAQPAPDLKAEEDGLLRSLTNPLPATLIQHSKTISKHLTEQPLVAERHEQSALLIGVFALREAACHFHDPRREMCRITAHLSIAKALRAGQPQSISGQLANLMLLSLAGRQHDVVEGIQSISAEHVAWTRALHLRSTCDWRIVKDPLSATFLEQGELARALNSSIGPNKVIELLQTIKAEKLPDWNRIVMQRNFGVAEGHLFVYPSLGDELKEFAANYELWSGASLKKEELIPQLNIEPSRGLVRVNGKTELQSLNWGMWAAFHQRHVCQSLVFTHLFLDKKWGVREEAEKFKGMLQKKFSELRLYPLVWQRIAIGEEYPDALTKATDLCKKHPSLLTAINWVHLLERKDIRNRPSIDTPSANPWFTPDLPLGCTYDFGNRYYELHQLYNEPASFWDEIIRVAPYSFDVLRTHRYKQHGSSPSAEQTHRSFARIIDFHFVAMREYSDGLKHDPQAYADAIQQASKLDPDILAKAGDYFVENNRPDLALQAYEGAFEKAQDRVLMANHSRWLVDYYFDHDRKDDALKVASAAAEVYSSSGLETMGHLMERMDNLEKAEEQYAAIEERYENSTPLLAFYGRHKDANDGIKTALQEREKEHFPDGMKKVSIADFTAVPTSGCKLTSNTQLTREARLNAGDVIVAFEGIKIDDADQYIFARSLSDALPIHLVIWDGQSYREVEASPPDRRFNCDLDDYP